MTNVIIVHGTGGGPSGNWFPWLKSELEKLDCNVYVPAFPTPEHQSLQSWLEVFKEYESYLDERSIVVGHSLGPLFLLHVLETLGHPIKAAFFVAGFTGLLNNPTFDELNKSFVTKNVDWTAVKQNCKTFYVMNSDNDPYVPIEQGAALAQHLETELITLPGAGHINAEAGYTEFDFLLEKIQKEL